VLHHDRRVRYVRPGLCLHRPLHLRVFVQLLVPLTARPDAHLYVPLPAARRIAPLATCSS